MTIDISMFPDAFVPFSVKQLRHASVVWLNANSIRDLRPTGISTHDWVLEHLSYAIPDGDYFPSNIFVEHTEKIVLAERYGGSGLAQNGGGGRSGIINGVLVKGCGRNPLVGKGTDEWHAYGGLSLVDAAIEAINSEVFNHILPRGAICCHGILLTGANTAFMPSGRHNQGPGALLIRELCARPAHYLLARGFEVMDAYKALILEDPERTRRVNVELCSRLGGHAKAIELAGNFLSACAEQFAFARLFRIYHGALSPSNISFDGRWLDLGNVSFVSSGLNFAPSTSAPSLHTELYCAEAYVKEFIDTYAKYNSTNFNFAPLTAFFHTQVEAALFHHTLSLFGLFGTPTTDLGSMKQYQLLIDHIRRLSEGEHEFVAASPVTNGCVDDVTMFLEHMFSALGRQEDVSSLEQAFQEVMRHSFAHAKGFDSYRTFTRFAIIESLKKAHFCQLFTRSRMLVDLLKIVDDGDMPRLENYINDQVALSRWIFSESPSDIAILFESSVLEVWLHRESGLYHVGTKHGETLRFKSAVTVSNWIDQQHPRMFYVDNHSLKDGLQRILSVLSKTENSLDYHG